MATVGKTASANGGSDSKTRARNARPRQIPAYRAPVHLRGAMKKASNAAATAEKFAYKMYMRTGTGAPKRSEARKAAPGIPGPIMKLIMQYLKLAEKAPISPRRIPQLPGPTKFAFQSAAERFYKKAIALAAGYDTEMVKNIRVLVAERFYSKELFNVAFEWAKASGNPETIRKIGTKAAMIHQWAAEILPNTLVANQKALGLYRKALVFVRECNPYLAKEIVMDAAKRFEDFGDMCVSKASSSLVGLQFGYSMAIRWANKIDKDAAEAIHKKVVGLYQNDPWMNHLTLAFAIVVMGDAAEARVITEVLDNRKTASKPKGPIAAT